jgi:hypothetical protein
MFSGFFDGFINDSICFGCEKKRNGFYLYEIDMFLCYKNILKIFKYFFYFYLNIFKLF